MISLIVQCSSLTSTIMNMVMIALAVHVAAAITLAGDRTIDIFLGRGREEVVVVVLVEVAVMPINPPLTLSSAFPRDHLRSLN